MSAFRRYVDSMVQTFEDSRDGVSDQALAAGPTAVAPYFVELYEREASRLAETIREQEPHLSDAALAALTGEVDDYVRQVLIPAYARLAASYTPRERRDFYLVPENLRGLERVGWGVVGILVGLFVIWAPFIPLWSKEWILPFMLAGLIYPNIRRFLAASRYEKQVNRVVDQTARSFERLEKSYLIQGDVIPELDAVAHAETEEDLQLRRKRQLANKSERER